MSYFFHYLRQHLMLIGLVLSTTASSSKQFSQMNHAPINEAPHAVSENSWKVLNQTIHDMKLLPSPAGIGSEDAGFFGESVAVEGDRALIGAPGVLGHGVVFVFDWIGDSWVKTDVLEPVDGEDGDQFGGSVSLSGGRVLVGAYQDDDFGNASGAAYVFEFNQGVWTQTNKLLPQDPAANDHFGRAVSLFADRALIGSSQDDDNNTSSGSVYVFDLVNGQWSETFKIKPDDGAFGDVFGYSVSLSTDRALIGAYGDDDEFNLSGSAYIFDYFNGQWSQTQKLTAADSQTWANFGYAVSLDGDRALVGAYNDDSGFIDSGSAYVFELAAGVWGQTEKLTASDQAESDRFGRTVMLSGDRALIGSRDDDDNGLNSGSAYLFELNGGVWSETIKLTPNDGALSDWFGAAVGLSGDRVIIGANGDNDFFPQSGSAYYFALNEGTWSQQQKLTAGEGAAADQFGFSVSISGNRALVGAIYDKDNGNNSGSAYIFEYNDSDWIQTAKLLAADGEPFDVFGYSVSLSGDRALVGAFGEDDQAAQSGAAYIFELDSGVWSQTAKLKADNASADDFFGYSVSLSGSRALVGAYLADGKGITDSGAAYMYDLVGGIWIQTTELNTDDAEVNDRLGVAVSLDGDRALVGAFLEDDNGNNAGSAYVFDNNMGTWNQTQKLLANDGSGFDHFGRAVSLSGNRALVGAYLDDENGTNSGSAYVFDFDVGSWSQSSKLMASDGVLGDEFGRAVSLEGDRALVGAYLDDDQGIESGSAYVFELSDGSWSQLNKLTAADGQANDQYGFSVSLEGDAALIGAFLTDDHGLDSGSAYVVDVVPKYTVSVDVSGLASGNSVAFRNNGVDPLLVSTNGLTTFVTPIRDGNAYDVTVHPPQPSNPNQICVVTDPMGSIESADVVLDVVCTTLTYFIGVTVTGLDDNNTIELTTNMQSLVFNTNTMMNFPLPLDDGTDYSVLLTAQPVDPNQTCVVTGGNSGSNDGSGALNGMDAMVAVDCTTNQYAIGINLSGLAATNSVSFTNGDDTLMMFADGLSVLSTLDDGSLYDVNIATQPQSPNQTCSFLSANSGTLAGLGVQIEVSCITNSYFIGGIVDGLLSGNYLVLQNNGGDDKVITVDGPYIFDSPLLDEQTYSVTIDLQPNNPIQPCFVQNGQSTLAGADVTNVNIECLFGDDLIFRDSFGNFD